MRETDDEVFMTRSLKLSMLTPTTIEQNLIVHNGKKAAITNNNILHSRYCTAEANENRQEASRDLSATSDLLVPDRSSETSRLKSDDAG